MIVLNIEKKKTAFSIFQIHWAASTEGHLRVRWVRCQGNEPKAMQDGETDCFLWSKLAAVIRGVQGDPVSYLDVLKS